MSVEWVALIVAVLTVAVWNTAVTQRTTIVTTDNSRITAENSRTTAENTRLTADNDVVTTVNHRALGCEYRRGCRWNRGCGVGGRAGRSGRLIPPLRRGAGRKKDVGDRPEEEQPIPDGFSGP